MHGNTGKRKMTDRSAQQERLDLIRYMRNCGRRSWAYIGGVLALTDSRVRQIAKAAGIPMRLAGGPYAADR